MMTRINRVSGFKHYFVGHDHEYSEDGSMYVVMYIDPNYPHFNGIRAAITAPTQEMLDLKCLEVEEELGLTKTQLVDLS